jgi:hypothetical protein
MPLKLELVYKSFRYSVHASEKHITLTLQRPVQSNTFTEIIGVYTVKHMKSTNALFQENAELLDGIYAG